MQSCDIENLISGGLNYQGSTRLNSNNEDSMRLNTVVQDKLSIFNNESHSNMTGNKYPVYSSLSFIHDKTNFDQFRANIGINRTNRTNSHDTKNFKSMGFDNSGKFFSVFENIKGVIKRQTISLRIFRYMIVRIMLIRNCMMRK